MSAQEDRDAMAVLRVELAVRADSLTRRDTAAVRVALATIAQQVHALQLTHDPQRNTCPRITHHNGHLVARYTQCAR